MAKWWKYIVNPVGAIAQDLTKDSKAGTLGAAISGILNPGDSLVQAFSGDKYHDIGDITNEGISNVYDWITTGEGGQGISKAWDDFTGKSQTLLQNQLNKEMADYQFQKDLESIGATRDAYNAAGLNPNLLAGGSSSPVGYNAPNLQAYSGSAKIDNILGKVGKALSIIPAMYNATAALEGIDQARERTKQSEIRTMAMGLNLLDQGYNLGDKALSHPFTPTLYPFRFGDKRHSKQIDRTSIGLNYEGFDQASRYADAALRHQFDLLNSIGIKNQMNTTLNNWRGYQYSLDRKYGAAGRIVGIASQGAGAINRLLSPVSSWFGKK